MCGCHSVGFFKVDCCREAEKGMMHVASLRSVSTQLQYLLTQPADTSLLWQNIKAAHSNNLPACSFVFLPNQLESRDCHVGKRLANCMLFSRWMWLLSHGDVTFQQEAQDETLSEAFVPPGCMAECWVQGCWPSHHFISTSAAALRFGPSQRHSASTRASCCTHCRWRWQPHFSFVFTQLPLIREISRQFWPILDILRNVAMTQTSSKHLEQHILIQPGHPPPFCLGWLVRQWKTTDILEVKWEGHGQNVPMVHRVKDTHKVARCGFKNSRGSYIQMWYV